ncbi:hypothetical protein [Aquitalea aquatilis]|uniref:hypothetical protein n=1 Tax=Aquitalea aquatilis TaxID=1537400 RepID=UPI0010BD3960|nr:hypothetical protein [Aquitalea aquatilis]
MNAPFALKPSVTVRASSPDKIQAVEEATGRIAKRDRRSMVVRLVPALRLVTSTTKQVSA